MTEVRERIKQAMDVNQFRKTQGLYDMEKQWALESLLTAIEALERIKLTGFSDHVKLRQIASEALAKIGASDV